MRYYHVAAGKAILKEYPDQHLKRRKFEIQMCFFFPENLEKSIYAGCIGMYVPVISSLEA